MRIAGLARLVAGCAVLVSLIACAPAAPAADITVTEDGCSTDHFLLPAEREPLISIANQAGEPMVLTIPTLNRWVSIAPGERAAFELPRYIMGRFDFFCLSEVEHTELAGGNPFLCSMEPAQVAPRARSGGMFEIEQHDRLQQMLAQTASAGGQ